jgi:hypothetical protein
VGVFFSRLPLFSSSLFFSTSSLSVSPCRGTASSAPSYPPPCAFSRDWKSGGGRKGEGGRRCGDGKESTVREKYKKAPFFLTDCMHDYAKSDEKRVQ